MSAATREEQRALAMLDRWAEAVEPFWNDLEDGFGCYGPGYIHWGVQSNFNFAAAVSTLAQFGGVRADHWRQRGLAALRFALATHVSGERQGLNGQQWGHSWISMLGIERAMHGVAHLEPLMTEHDRVALRRVLVSEAHWVLHEGHRGGHRDVNGALWNSSGRNVPESNIWAGTLLWRVAQRYPEEPEAALWAERAHAYLINGISVPDDATDDRVVAGKPVRARHVGPNFFPHYALDHHGYLNVGYMAICASNAAILHFDLRRAALASPESLHHHQADMWAVLRRMIFPDGRLVRIGGDSRVRYSYCQEYLLPALLYAADQHGDPHALELAAGQIGLMQREHDASDDGTFYGRRLAGLRAANPHYFTRLESDRACVLAMLLNYLPLVKPPPLANDSFETSVAGGWVEPAHGAALWRGSKRLASFAWRANGLTQAHCQPPDASDMAEWAANLCPVVRYLGDDGQNPGTHRRLLDYWVETFEGGFVTCGRVREGVDIRVDEGAYCTDQATTLIAFAALPDGQTCLGMQYVTAANDRIGYTVEVKSLHFNLPNDLFNNWRRDLATANGIVTLEALGGDEIIDLESSWVNIDESIGLIALYGGDRLRIARSSARRAGRYQSLYIDEICLDFDLATRRQPAGAIIVDVGFAIVAEADATATAEVTGGPLPLPVHLARGVWVTGRDGRRYALVANISDANISANVFGEDMYVPAGQARVCVA